MRSFLTASTLLAPAILGSLFTSQALATHGFVCRGTDAQGSPVEIEWLEGSLGLVGPILVTIDGRLTKLSLDENDEGTRVELGGYFAGNWGEGSQGVRELRFNLFDENWVKNLVELKVDSNEEGQILRGELDVNLFEEPIHAKLASCENVS